ncbi:MAG: hypothetical protein WBM11_00650 [Terriglobales bacterium]
MARGWESKSVEEQQSQAAFAGKKPRAPSTPQELARQRERQGLRLSRARVMQQLETAQNTHHRQMLASALADLDAQLARLG